MEKKLNILVIEDSQADFLMVERHLQQQGLEANCSRVDSMEALEHALTAGIWDLILSDYSVPRLSFRESFALVSSRLPNLPVILVSGSVGEEQAVDLLKLGVCDFVLKDNLTRLVPSVKRALKESAEYQARLAVEESLRENENRFRGIFDNSPIAIGIGQIDNGKLIEVNNAWLELFGYERSEVIGRTTTELNLYVKANQRDELIDIIREHGRILNHEIQFRRKSGEVRDILYSAEIIKLGSWLHLQVMMTDITEQHRLEEQLRQSQKMEAIGTLAGGIAHDFNNILTAIAGYSTLLQMEVKLDGKPQEYIDNLMALTDRAANLTKGLLAFSRNQVMMQKQIDLNEIVVTITKLISRLIGENITVESNLSAHPLTIMADCGQIEQVLMNLATNARDAMHGGGRLKISTEMVNLEPHNPLLGNSNPPGPHALLTVSDTGIGMDEATAARIFEPFFTTKEPGKGTGLGLSIMYGIIKQHQGFVTVASRPEDGTTFSIYLPLAIQSEVAAIGKTSSPVAGGTETVLIAEDDPAIRKVIRQILQQFGYGVLEAGDGVEAVDIFREHAASISLVILDAFMPRSSGCETFETITGIRPDVKCLVISGYPADTIAQRKLLPDGAAFLPKPVSPMDLLKSIRQLLDG